MKRTYLVNTLGCRVNQYESMYLSESLASLGFEKAAYGELPDVYILNTCSVTGESDKKSRAYISRILRKADEAERNGHKRPLTVVTGCHAQGSYGKDALLDECDIVCGNENKDRLPGMIFEALERKEKIRDVTEIKRASRCPEMRITRSELVKAYVKIEDGCAGFCSYCLVPLVRGRPRSRTEDDIIDEVTGLVKNGYSEIIFTGIEVGDYGKGTDIDLPLVQLVRRADKIEGIKRIRLGSLNPKLVTEKFVSELSEAEHMMPHFHLSLQSGNDEVLAAMRRKYTHADETDAVKNIYSYFPDACISADVICGFPTETEEQFYGSVDTVLEGKLIHTHIFPYSKRDGTPAALMKEQIPPEEKKRRTEILNKASEEARKKRLSELYGKSFNVLCEISRGGKIYGHTENFIYVCAGDGDESCVGKYFPVTLSENMIADKNDD